MINFHNLFQTPISELVSFHNLITYGAFRPSQLEAIYRVEIRQQILRQLLTTTLEINYLLEPIIKGLQQLQQDGKNKSLIKVYDLFIVLKEGLFHRHLIKVNIYNQNNAPSNNNMITSVNVRIIIAAILVFSSKKLSLDQIASNLRLFELQEPCNGLKPFGLPLQLNYLQKLLKKIQRTINLNALKNFMVTSKEEKDSNYIQPDQFLYFISLTKKKIPNSTYFFERKRIRTTITPEEVNVDTHEEKSKEENKVVRSEVIKEKVRGLSMIESVNHQKSMIFKNIKNTLFGQKKQKSKSLYTGLPQLQKQNRSQSPLFLKSLSLLQKIEGKSCRKIKQSQILLKISKKSKERKRKQPLRLVVT